MKIKTGVELLLVNLLAILLIAAAVLFSSHILGVILGVPVMLFFPGYALMAAMFPKKSDLDGIERVALSFGLSIALVGLAGLALNYAPWGFRLYPVLLSIGLFIAAMSVIAAVRSAPVPVEDRFAVSFRLSFPAWRGSSRFDKALAVGLLLGVVCAVWASAYILAVLRTGGGFTEFYILGQEGGVGKYPERLALGEEGRVMVNIVNRERQTMSYRVEVRIDGVVSSETGPLVLEPDEKWVEEMSFAPHEAGDDQRVEFLLYRNAQSEPYLKPLQLWVNVAWQK